MAEPTLSAYLHNKAAAGGFPVAGNFELTPRCCFDCKMCYVHLTEEEQRRRGSELSADQWLRIGEEACRCGLVFLLLTGGEPSLRPDFMEILSGLKRMGLLISVNSNGWLLRGELLEQILRDPPPPLQHHPLRQLQRELRGPLRRSGLRSGPAEHSRPAGGWGGCEAESDPDPGEPRGSGAD